MTGLRLTPFRDLIKDRCGLLFEGNGEEKLASALNSRMEETGLDSASDYYTLLQGNEEEFQHLVNLLTINETYFFREPEQIRLLTERLAPRLLARTDHQGPVRILSAGCSSGEEPYSLVMALQEKYGESVSRLFAFAGGDIDSAVLAKARSGRYTEFSFRGVPEKIRHGYFDKDHRGYVLKESIRSLVEFRELNLLAKSFSPALQGFDIIFFRNVSIYFDAPTRKLIQQALASLLKDDGYLVIGTAETLANDLGVLPLVEEDNLFYFVKGTALIPEGAPAAPVTWLVPPIAPASRSGLTWSMPDLSSLMPAAATPTLLPEPVALPVTVAVASPAALPAIQAVQDLVREKRFDEALPQLDVLLTADPAHVAALLLKAHIHLNRKDFASAEAAAQTVLATDPWNTDAFMLLGQAAKWQEQPADAIRWLKQAAYAHHECWPAHYFLADLYRQSGEAEQARRSYRVVLQLLAEDATPDTGIKVLPLGLPPGEIRFLCQHQLTKMGLPGSANAVGVR